MDDATKSYGTAGYWVFFIIAVIVAYYIGAGSVGGEYNDPEEVVTEEEYRSAVACFERLVAQNEEIHRLSDIGIGEGYGASYEELSASISEIASITSGTLVSVQKVPSHPESGYYDCP